MSLSNKIQNTCAIIGVLGMWFAYASLNATNKQVEEAVRQNNFSVQPFVVPYLVKNNEQLFVNLKNHFDKPASNIHLAVRDNSVADNKFFIGKQSIEFLLSTHNNGVGNIQLNTDSQFSKQDLIKELEKVYGKENVENIKNEIQESKSSIYVFYLDLNNKLRVAIRDFDMIDGKFTYFYRVQHTK